MFKHIWPGWLETVWKRLGNGLETVWKRPEDGLDSERQQKTVKDSESDSDREKVSDSETVIGSNKAVQNHV